MADFNIDLAAIQAEISNLSEADLRNQLLEVRTKQKVQQKKYHNTETQKNYQRKRNASIKAMTEIAKSKPAPAGSGFANLYAFIQAQAAQEADKRIAAEQATDVDGVEVDEETLQTA